MDLIKWRSIWEASESILSTLPSLCRWHLGVAVQGQNWSVKLGVKNLSRNHGGIVLPDLLHGLLSLLCFYTTEAPMPSSGTSHCGLSPLTSMINQGNKNTPQVSLMEAILNWGFLLPGYSSWQKLTSACMLVSEEHVPLTICSFHRPGEHLRACPIDDRELPYQIAHLKSFLMSEFTLAI